VSGCRTHGELIGPFVLGGLEPDEVEEMRRHLAHCEACAAEAELLAGLPALLDRAQADDTVATLSPRLEEEVLDRFVRERAQAGRTRRRWPRLAVPAAAAAVVVAVVLALVLPGGGGGAYASAELWTMPAGGGAAGSADLEEVAAGTRVALRAHDLPVSRGEMFELWCVRDDGRWVNGGSFHARSDGSASAELTAAVKPGDYHVVVVTRHTAGGQPGDEVMRGKLVY